MIDTYCNQPLRATLDTEFQSGPDYRITVQTGTGNGRVILQRWPVLSIESVAISANTFPRQFQAVPANCYDIEHPVIGLYGTSVASGAGEGGQSILIQAGWINWGLGRNGFWVRTQYVNGWPHTSLTQPANIGDMVLHVDDCTGWATTSETLGSTGVTGVIYDNSGQEVAQATATSTTAGPGIVTLAAPLVFPHAAGTLFTSLPASVIQAGILFSTAQALTRGSTTTTVQSIPGAGTGAAGAKGVADLSAEAELLLNPFRRVI